MSKLNLKISGKVVASEFLGYTKSGVSKWLFCIVDDIGRGHIVRNRPNIDCTDIQNAYSTSKEISITCTENTKGQLVIV